MSSSAYLREIEEAASRQGVEASWWPFLRASILINHTLNYVLLKPRRHLARVGWLRTVYRRAKRAFRRRKTAVKSIAL